MNTPEKPKGTPTPNEIPDDDFEEFLEWTPEEEDAFMSIIQNRDKKELE